MKKEITKNQLFFIRMKVKNTILKSVIICMILMGSMLAKAQTSTIVTLNYDASSNCYRTSPQNYFKQTYVQKEKEIKLIIVDENKNAMDSCEVFVNQVNVSHYVDKNGNFTYSYDDVKLVPEYSFISIKRAGKISRNITIHKSDMKEPFTVILEKPYVIVRK